MLSKETEIKHKNTGGIRFCSPVINADIYDGLAKIDGSLDDDASVVSNGSQREDQHVDR